MVQKQRRRYRVIPPPTPPGHAPYLYTAAAPAWQHESNVGTAAARWATEGVGPVWKDGAPEPRYVRGRFAHENTELVYRERDKFLQTGAVFAAPSQDPDVLVNEYGCFISPTFVRVVPGKKDRWCFNYKLLKSYEKHCGMKLEMLSTLPLWGMPGMWMWSKDIKSAFHCLRYRDEVLRFFVIDCGPAPDGSPATMENPRFLLCVAMPFGWSRSPYLWNKVSRRYLNHARQGGVVPDEVPSALLEAVPPVHTTLYVDDQAAGHADREVSQRQEQYCSRLLVWYGFPEAPDKGQAVVAQSLDFLGMIAVTSTADGMWVAPEAKLAQLRLMAGQLLREGRRAKMFVWARGVASYIGVCISLLLAIPEIRFRTRNLQTLLTRSGCYSHPSALSRQVKFGKRHVGELKWMLAFSAPTAMHRTIWQRPVTRVLATDASLAVHAGEAPGWGAVLGPEVQGEMSALDRMRLLHRAGEYDPKNWDCQQVAHGMWSSQDLLKRIHTLELSCLRLGGKKWSEQFRNSVILWFEDNQAVIRVMRNLTTRSDEMYEELELVVAWLREYNASVIMRFVQSADNCSDYFSRLCRRSDSTFSPRVLTTIFSVYGRRRPTIDRFNHHYDKVVGRCNAPYLHPAVEAADAHADVGRRDELAQPALGLDRQGAHEAATRAGGGGAAGGARLDDGAVVAHADRYVHQLSRVGALRQRHRSRRDRQGHAGAAGQLVVAAGSVPHSARSQTAHWFVTTADHDARRREHEQRGQLASFPAPGERHHGLQLGIQYAQQFIGPLLEASTLGTYSKRVQHWMEFNAAGGFDWREVTDAKFYAFAGWLADPGGGNSTDKCLNNWTSAINSFFDIKFGCRPCNTHYIGRLKKKYHDAQLARTVARLPPGQPLPKEARVGVPIEGLLQMEEIALSESTVRTVWAASCMLCTLFWLRPNTLWHMLKGDVRLDVGAGVLVLTIRGVKRWPELRQKPARREVPIPSDPRHPRRRLIETMLRAQEVDAEWYLELSRTSTEHDAGATVSAWMRDLMPTLDVQRWLPAGKRLSSYSLRICGVSVCDAYEYSPRWMQDWGFWRSIEQAQTYVQLTPYGRQGFLGAVYDFAVGIRDVGQGCCDYTTTAAARPVGPAAVGQSRSRTAVLRALGLSGRRGQTPAVHQYGLRR